MTLSKKVLILYITERSGHHSAALAIKNALELKDSLASVSCVNAFKYAFPFAERIIHHIYLAVIKRVPKIWNNMYDNPELFGKSQGIKKWINRLAIRKLKGLVETFRPDVIVCTQAFPCGIVADYKKIYNSDISLIGVLTDLEPHSFWVYDHVDYYIAPIEESRELLIRKGVAEDKILTLGIPIDPKFSRDSHKKEIMVNYYLKPELPVIMVMGGGHGLGPIKDVLSEFDKSLLRFQIIAICGLNTKLYQWINKTKFKNRILAFKFTDQIEQLMTISDLIITKPGGITIAESLAKKLPIIVLNPIPGQEERNTQILLKSGAALRIDSVSELLPAVNKILASPRNVSFIFSFLKHSNRLAKPRSSLDIAEFILSL